MAAIFFLIGMIIFIVDFSDLSSPPYPIVLDFIMILLLTLVGGAAGLLAIASLFNMPKLAFLGRVCQASILGYIVLWTAWAFVNFVFVWIKFEVALVYLTFTDRLYSSCLMAVMAVGAVELVSGALALLKPKPQAAA